MSFYFLLIDKCKHMKSLSETWFADGYIDFELKKYTLLAYLKEVNKYFDEHKSLTSVYILRHMSY